MTEPQVRKRPCRISQGLNGDKGYLLSTFHCRAGLREILSASEGAPLNFILMGGGARNLKSGVQHGRGTSDIRGVHAKIVPGTGET